MLYENEICAGCGQPMAEKDDVVVCPECGTPQHRACWESCGHCVNLALHAEGFEWSRSASPAAAASETPGEEPVNQEEKTDAGEMTCPYCGEVNSADALHCKNCGTPFSAGAVPPYGRVNPYLYNVNMGENDPLGSTTAGKAAAYVGSSARRYLPKFKKMADKGGKGASWNWAAFLFSPFWFFFRKLNKAGIFLTAVLVTITLVSTPFYNAYFDEVAKVYAPYEEEINSGTLTQEQMNDIINKTVPVTNSYSTQLGIIAAVNIAFHIVCGFIANKAYYKKMLEDLKLIKEAAQDESMSEYITVRRGGISFMNLVAGYCGYNLVLTLISYLVS